MTHESTRVPDDTPDELVHVIVAETGTYDHENRWQTTYAVVQDEGWFADANAADVRAEELRGRLRQMHDVDENRRQRAHAKERRAVQQAIREAEILNAAGITKNVPTDPGQYTPRNFDAFLRSLDSYTTYSTKTMSRSEHDVPSAPAVPGDKEG